MFWEKPLAQIPGEETLQSRSHTCRHWAIRQYNSTYCGHSRYWSILASWIQACPFFPTPLNSPSTLLWDEEHIFYIRFPAIYGAFQVHLKIVNSRDVFPVFIKHDDLVDTEHDAGSGDLPRQVCTKLSGLSVVQDRTRQSHTHGVRPAWEKRQQVTLRCTRVTDIVTNQTTIRFTFLVWARLVFFFLCGFSPLLLVQLFDQLGFFRLLLSLFYCLQGRINGIGKHIRGRETERKYPRWSMPVVLILFMRQELRMTPRSETSGLMNQQIVAKSL